MQSDPEIGLSQNWIIIGNGGNSRRIMSGDYFKERMMRLSILAPLTAMLLCGCASQPTERVLSAPKRELASAEKASLATTLSQTLKDPGAAQFKWMPIVLLERDGITDYCGLLNGRNAYGGYVGYQKFYAQLNKNDKGEYVRGQVRITASDEVSIAVANDVCDKYGYTDFSQAR